MAGKAGRAKVDNNPFLQMQAELEKLGDAGANFDHWQAKWYRRNGMNKNYLGQEDAFAFEYVPQVEEITREKYGGGAFTVEFVDPNGIFPKPIVYSFSVAGDPKQDAETKTTTPIDPVAAAYAKGASAAMGGGMSPLERMEARRMGMQMVNPYGIDMSTYRPPQRDDREGELKADLAKQREINERMSKDLENLRLDMVEERRKRDADVAEERHKGEMEKLRAETAAQTDKILARLDAKERDSAISRPDTNIEMMKMMSERDRESMKMFSEFSRRDLEGRKENLEYLARMTEAQQKFLQEQATSYAKLNDPMKTAEFLDIIGKRTIDSLEIITQMAESGLIGGSGGGEDMHPALKTVVNLVDGLKDFGSKYLQMKQQEATQRAKMMNQPVPFVSPGLPVGGMRPPAPGQTPQQPPAQPAQPQPPQTQENLGQSLITHAISQIGTSVFVKKEDPEKIAEMMYVHFDYMRFIHCLPDDLKDIFERPEEVITALFQDAAARGYTIEAGYRDKIIASFKGIIEEMKEEEEKGDGEDEPLVPPAPEEKKEDKKEIVEIPADDASA